MKIYWIIIIILAVVASGYTGFAFGKWHGAYIAPEPPTKIITKECDCPECLPEVGVVECPEGTIEALKNLNLCEQAYAIAQETIKIQNEIIDKLK